MRSKRIFVVEDEAIVAADLQDRLRALGYEPVGVVAAGEEALLKVEEAQADLVLMDIQLKGSIDGVEAAERIRERLDIPIVFLTARVDEATFRRAKITAPFGYVRKPYEERELHTALEIAFYRHATEAQLRKTQQWLETVIESVGDALVVTDKWGLVELINSAAGTLSGWRPQDALLKPLSEVFQLIESSTQAPLPLPAGDNFDGEPPAHSRAPVVLQNLSGSRLPVEYSVSPIRDGTGSVTGMVWLFTRPSPAA
jgi:PAS domain S-box-containing protein